MDMSTILQAVSSVGFPIVACCGMFYLYDRTIKDLTLAMAKIDTTMELILKMLDNEKD